MKLSSKKLIIGIIITAIIVAVIIVTNGLVTAPKDEAAQTGTSGTDSAQSTIGGENTGGARNNEGF
jgi:hypothetical protein